MKLRRKLSNIVKEHSFNIYPLDESDIPDLVEIAIRTFSETFSSINTAQDMEEYNTRSFTREQFLKELQNPDSYFYFIRCKEEIAGYLKVNIGKAQTEIREANGFEVERIYVLAKYYGDGVGKAFMDHAIKLGKEHGKQYLWLGVWEHNYRAQKFYAKYKMKEFGDHVFMMGNTPQRDILLRMELS